MDRHKTLSCALLIASFFAVPGWAQEETCGSDVDSRDVETIRTLVASGAYDPPVGPGGLASRPTAIPVTVHVVRRDDGSTNLDPEQITQAFVDLNAAFEAANLRFYRCGPIRYLDDTSYYIDICGNDDMNDLLGEDRVENTINLYFVGALKAGNGTNLCGRATFSHSTAQGIIVKNVCAGVPSNPSTVPHEFGHYLDLYHTHETSLGQECANGSNAGTTGDLLPDTPADPRLESDSTDPDYNTNNCFYFGLETDPCGELYAPDPTNLMSYSAKTCRVSFTPQQIQRMRATLFNLRPELIGGCTAVNGFVSGTAEAGQAPAPGSPIVFARRACDETEAGCLLTDDGQTTDDFLTASLQIRNDDTAPLGAHLRIEADRGALGGTQGFVDITRFFRIVAGGPLVQPMTFDPGTTDLLLEVRASIPSRFVDLFPVNLPILISLEEDTPERHLIAYRELKVGLRPNAGYYDDDIVCYSLLTQDPVQPGDAFVVEFDPADLASPGGTWVISGVEIVGAELGGSGLPGLPLVELRLEDSSNPGQPDLSPVGLVRSAGPVTLGPAHTRAYVDFPDIIVTPPPVPLPNLYIFLYLHPGDSAAGTATAIGASDSCAGEVLVGRSARMLGGQLPLIPLDDMDLTVRLDMNGNLAGE